MANEEDLVSQVRVEGTDAEAAELEKFASRGEAAFAKLAAAAKAAGVTISGSTSGVNKFKASLGEAAGAATQTGNSFKKINLGSFGADLKQIEQGTKQLVAVTRSAIPAIASFVTRLTGLGTAAAAAGVGILKLADNVAKSSRTQESAIDKQTEAAQRSNEQQGQLRIGAINLESQQRQLFKEFQKGEISFSDYSKSLKKLNDDYKEQQRVARQTEAVQESVRLENERLTKQAADTKAFQAQADIFGGPLLSSLIQLGNQAGQLFNQFKQTFGPALAAAIDTINQALTTNGAAISKFFTEASTKITTFISQNGPAIQQAFQNIGAGIKVVFDGIIAALPGLLSFFNNNLVPALTAFGSLLSGIATTINTVFGTNLTGGAIVFLVVLGQMTGAFVALINVIRIVAAVFSIIIGLPFGPAILLIGAAIAALLIVFPQLRQVALDILSSILQAFQGLAAGAKAAGLGIVAAFNAVITFFSTMFALISAAFSAGWEGLKTAANAFIQFIKDGFNGIVTAVSTVIDQIKTFFSDLGTTIVNAFTSAFATLRNLFNSFVATAKQLLQPILDLLNAIAGLSGSATGAATGGPVTAAGGGHIRGPGTSTSDSIPAWLSDGEFVIKAKSAAKYGLGFLNAINSGRFRMPRFNMGGLVSAFAHGMMPGPVPRLAYADGGPVNAQQSMRPMQLNIFGEDFGTVFAPEDVGSKLTKFAVAKQNRSAGRKPGWKGRGRNNA